jgi:NADP-dependent 3-hydroxy acid dehydrogenase YdfG
MDLGLADRVFLVTAASAGLGRATAQQLVAEGLASSSSLDGPSCWTKR